MGSGKSVRKKTVHADELSPEEGEVVASPFSLNGMRREKQLRKRGDKQRGK